MIIKKCEKCGKKMTCYPNRRFCNACYMDKKRENNKTDGLIIKNRSKPLVNSNQTEEEYADMKEEELKKFHSPREEFKRKYRRYPSVDELNQYNKNKSNY